MKNLFVGLLLATVMLGAAEIAITTTGKKVVLKNDGSWEPFDPSRHVVLEDQRAKPEIRFNLGYKDSIYYGAEMKSYWEALELSAPALADSLASLPSGGVVTVMIDENSPDVADPRNYNIRVLNSRGRELATTKVRDADAVDSDDVGWKILVRVMLAADPGSSLQVRIVDAGIGRNWEFDMPVAKH